MRTIPGSVVAIDAHVHLADETWAATVGDHEVASSIATFFGRRREVVPIDEMASEYRARGMMAVIMNTTDSTVTGRASVPNDHVAEVVDAYPDVFLGFGVVDPWQGKLAEKEIARCKSLGLIGIGELNPARQHFRPNDQRFYPLWAAARELGLVVAIHGGYAAAGTNRPGGAGVKLGNSRPILIDDVAADFPDLQLICAHPSWPWESEALAVAMHKRNVHLDLSGYAPRYFSDELRRSIKSRIPDKVLFGSDWPSLTVERWTREFEDLDLPPEVREKVLLTNAMRLFQLQRS